MKRRNIYMFTTPMYRQHSLYKVGMTTKEVVERVNHWEGGSPEDLEIEIAFSVPDNILDYDVFDKLKELGAYRPKPNHEWFETNIEQVTTILRNLTENDLIIYSKDNPEFKNLRPYQIEIDIAVDDFLSSDAQKGQVWSPTGSGKTESFINTIRKRLGNGSRTIIIHPRLKLSRDQLTRFKKSFCDHNILYINFNSGRNTGATLHYDEQFQVLGALDAEININKDIIVFTTYQSLNKLDLAEFDLAIFDEAHNATNYYNAVSSLTAKKMIFYTATPIIDQEEEIKSYQPSIDIGDKIKSQSRGMNNVDRFGEVIYQVTPRRLIREEYIVPPSIHQLELTLALNEETMKYENANPAHVCAVAFNEQYKDTVLKDGMPYAQMLASLSSTDDIKYVREHINEFNEKLLPELKNKVTVFSTFSNPLSNDAFKNNEPLNEDEESFTDKINNFKNNAVILHFKQIGEGIDISSITGFISLRDLRPSEYIQMMGRAGRPYEGDKIFDTLNNTMTLKSQKDRLKKRCIISIPTVQGKPVVIKNGEGEESQRSVEGLIDAFVNYGYDDMLTYMAKEGDIANIIGGHNRDNENKLSETLYSPILKAKIRRLIVALEEDYFSNEAKETLNKMTEEDKTKFIKKLQIAITKTPEVVNELLFKHRENRGHNKDETKPFFVVEQPFMDESIAKNIVAQVRIDGDATYLIYFCIEQADALIKELIKKGASPSNIDLKTADYCQTTEQWCNLLSINYIYDNMAK